MNVVPDPRFMSAEWEMSIIDPTTQDPRKTDRLANKSALYTHPIEGVRSVWSTQRSNLGTFLSNGSRFYKDTLNIAELSLAECQGADELTTHVQAGNEFIMRAVAEHGSPQMRVHRRLRSPGRGAGEPAEQLVRGLVPTASIHENYDVSRGNFDDQEELAHELVPFLIGRMVFNGAGYAGARPGSKRPIIMPTQRAQSISECMADSAIGRDKPWIKVTLESHKHYNGNDPTRLRLQVVGGDADMNPWATRFTFMSTSIALRLIENGISPSSLVLSDETMGNTTRSFAHDPEAIVTLPTTSGEPKQYRAVDVLEETFLIAYEHAGTGIFSADEEAFLEEWGHAIDEYRQDPHNLRDAVDWIFKDWYVKTKGITELSDMQAFDMEYDALTGVKNAKTGAYGPGRGYLLAKAGAFRYKPDQEAVERAIYTPPASSRATHRGALITALHELPDNDWELIVGWERVHASRKHGPLESVTVEMPELSAGELSDEAAGQMKRLFRIVKRHKQPTGLLGRMKVGVGR